MKNIQKNFLFTLVFFFTSLLFFYHPDIYYAETSTLELPVIENGQTIMQAMDSTGESVLLTQDEFNALNGKSITENSSIEDIKNSVQAYRRLQQDIFTLPIAPVANSNDYFDWANWQTNSEAKYEFYGENTPKLIGDTRFSLTLGTKLAVNKVGDTHPYVELHWIGIQTRDATNISNTYVTTTGDTQHLYSDLLRKNVIISGSKTFAKLDASYQSIPILRQYGVNAVASVKYNPDDVGSVIVQPTVEYNSTEADGYQLVNGRKVIWHTTTISHPQIVKSVNKDMADGSDLGYATDDGRGGHYGDNLSISGANIPGYTVDHYEYVEQNKTPVVSSETVWKGTLNNTKKGLVWWYVKNAENLSIKKTNSRETDKVRKGEDVDYVIDASNGGPEPLYDAKVEDTLPQGMGKPTDVKLTDDNGKIYAISEGKANANQDGEYYIWNQNSNILTVYLKDMQSLEQKKITYKSELLSGTDEEIKTNTAVLSGKNDGGIRPKAESKFVVYDKKPLMSIDKTIQISETEKVKEASFEVNDKLTYRIEVANSSADEPLKKPVIVDKLPTNLAKPENIRLGENGELLGEGIENANSKGEYYIWDSSTYELSVYLSDLGQRETRFINYDTKIMTGNDKDILVNIASVTGENIEKTLTSEAEVTVKYIPPVLLHIKQEVINPHQELVMPTIGYISLTNINLTSNKTVNTINTTIPSYKVDTNESFKTVYLKPSEINRGYTLLDYVPEFYKYVGYEWSTVEQTHQSINKKEEKLPTLDYSKNKEYWVTIYIEPSVEHVDSPPFYNWDYKTNDFGKLFFS